MPRLSADERRAGLVTAAIDVIAEAGIAGTTTRAVTSRAGMSLASFHYVFDSREQLFEACLDEVVRWEAEEFGSFRTTRRCMVGKARQILGHVAAMLRAHPEIQLALHQLCFHAQARPALAAKVVHYRTSTRALIADIVRTAMSDPDCPDGTADPSDDQVDAVAGLALTISSGMTVGYLRDGDEAELDRTVEIGARSLGAVAEAALADGSR